MSSYNDHREEGGHYAPALRRQLLDVAVGSIRHGLERGRPMEVSNNEYPASLRELRATFVTLHRLGELRGCIGGLTPRWPLVEDVALHAYAAAFEDPRFMPLERQELAGLHVSISVLGLPEPIVVASEAELRHRLRPHQDGLILQEGHHRATFLPSVWEQLPDPRDFLAHLKMKAGLSPTYWSTTLRFERYETESFDTTLTFAD